ncbi:MAG: RagB/SusD family nutrient uptake outer membrane protein [Bacteroidales bacterium]|nr:RagB/SusD family nutrient uptake outer membrane protein [Bacteroidales bacterium]
MKRYIKYGVFCLSSVVFAGCNDWLREDSPMLINVGDFFIASEAAIQSVNAAYAPLMWEYNSTYFSEWFIGDIASDDALKGGQNISDMADAYDIENFKTIDNNGLLLDYYRAKYQGIGRANLAIEQISAMEVDGDDMTQDLKDRLIGEAKFLRAYYYFSLVRVFGGVPKVEAPIYSSDGWIQPRASIDEIFGLIVSDLKDAESGLVNKSRYDAADLGRATKGAAQAMLAKVYMYWGDYTASGFAGAQATVDCYGEARTWAEKFLNEQAGEYSLCSKYGDNFTLEGENGPESIFEIQYTDEPTSDYGEGNGFTRGTFTTIMIRSRSTQSENSGWGFNKPTDNLVAEFEVNDPRLSEAVRVPKDSEMSNLAEEIYLGCRNLAVKRTLTVNGSYEELSHDSRSPLNNVVFRLSDFYLMYAELCLKAGDTPAAKTYLEMVRARARGTKDILPEFPGYSVPDYRNGYAMRQLSDTPEDLELAVRHERRVELAMEGHRWFDIVRWGVAKEIMDAYKAQETLEAQAEMSVFVKGKHELFPIPHEELLLGGLSQNSGY